MFQTHPDLTSRRRPDWEHLAMCVNAKDINTPPASISVLYFDLNANVFLLISLMPFALS